MSYLMASTTVDELLLMLAAHDGKTRPEPDPMWTNGLPIQARGMVFLNITDAALAARRFFYECPRNYRVMHLTWAGWDRVDELIAAGHRLPTEDELSEYARHAKRVVEGGDHGDFIPVNVPNPRGLVAADAPAPGRLARLKARFVPPVSAGENGEDRR